MQCSSKCRPGNARAYPALMLNARYHSSRLHEFLSRPSDTRPCIPTSKVPLSAAFALWTVRGAFREWRSRSSRRSCDCPRKTHPNVHQLHDASAGQHKKSSAPAYPEKHGDLVRPMHPRLSGPVPCAEHLKQNPGKKLAIHTKPQPIPNTQLPSQIPAKSGSVQNKQPGQPHLRYLYLMPTPCVTL